MNRDETKNIIRAVMSCYPNFKPSNLTDTINTWAYMLSNYTYKEVSMALKSFVLSDSSGFAPSVGQIVKQIVDMRNRKEDLSELDAWAKTRQAIGDGYYHSQERFVELPEICQRVVGSPDNLQRWALMDTSELESVVMSQFLRNYRIVSEQMRQERITPEYFPKIKKKIDVPQIEQVDVEQEMSRGIPMPDKMYKDVAEKLRYRE